MPKMVEKYDDSRVKFALDKAPQVFADEIDHWLNRERISFLGRSVRSQNKEGPSIRGLLLGKARWSRGGGWSPQMVGQFVSYKNDRDTLHPKMTMEFADKSPFHKSMVFLECGGTVSSSKFMPVPFYPAFQQITIGRWSQIQSPYYQFFKEKSAAGELIPIRPKGNSGVLYWFYNKFGNRLLAFIGRKNIAVKKQFNFHRKWSKREPKVYARGDQAVYRATRKVERMIKTGEIS